MTDTRTKAQRVIPERLHYVHGYGFAIGSQAINVGGDGEITDAKQSLLDAYNGMREALLAIPDDPAPQPTPTERDVIQWVSDTVGLSTDNEREMARRLAALRGGDAERAVLLELREAIQEREDANQRNWRAGITPCKDPAILHGCSVANNDVIEIIDRLLDAAPDQAAAGKVEPDPVMQRTSTDCMRACVATYFSVPYEEVPDLSQGDWMLALRDWLAPRGLGFFSADISGDALQTFASRGTFIVAGKSPRGVNHAVIYRDGRLWHDPHPEGGGIDSPTVIDLFVNLNSPDAGKVEPAPFVEDGRRDYTFRLAPSLTDRCHDCEYSLHHDAPSQGASCRRLQIEIADTRKSRCPLWRSDGFKKVEPAASPPADADREARTLGYKSLDHAMAILRTCVAPYSGEQAQKVANALKQWHDKWSAACDCIYPDERTTVSDLLAEVSRLTTERNEALAECDRLRVALDEREGDMHVRIRAGYDKTVADSWRAEVERLTRERDEAWERHVLERGGWAALEKLRDALRAKKDRNSDLDPWGDGAEYGLNYGIDAASTLLAARPNGKERADG